MKLKDIKFQKRQIKRIAKYEQRKKKLKQLMNRLGGYTSFEWWKYKYSVDMRFKKKEEKKQQKELLEKSQVKPDVKTNT